MRTNDKFLSTFLAVALGLVFFSVFPALSSRDDDEEDTVHKFEIAMSGKTGLSYKFLEELLDDNDSYGASVVGGKRKSLRITDATKFKKTFRDLHLSFLKSFDGDTDAIESCAHLERFGKYKDYAMRQIRIDGYYLFNITSERAIVKACGKGTLKMLNETVDALKLYAAEKLNPKLIKALQAFAKIDDEDESQSEDEDANRSEEGGGDNSVGQNEGSVQDEELEGHQSAAYEEGAELTEVVRDMLKSHEAQMEDKATQIKSLEDDIETQKGAIAALQPFQTIVSFLLKENEIDEEQFSSAMDEKKIEDIKSLLSPKFTGPSFEELVEELADGFDVDEDQGEEGSGDNGEGQSKDSVQDEELEGHQSAAYEEGAELTEVVRDMLKSHEAQMEDKATQIKSLEDDIETQKGAIAALQPFQTIVSFLLKENEIDEEQFSSAMDEKKIEDIKSLLSPKFTGLSFEELVEELANSFDVDEDQGEEGSGANGDANSD